MDKKYITYSLEELLEDKSFISWVLNENRNIEWKKFIEDNPEFNSTLKKATEIILLLRDSYDILDEDSVLELWHNIEQFDHLNRIENKKFRRWRIIGWAASVLFIISLGTLFFHYLNESETEYHFTSSEIQRSDNSAMIVLSDGEKVTLEGDNSSIELNSENELVIDNDSIINLSNNELDLEKEVQLNEVIVPYGKRTEILLTDGTKVWINAGSRFAFPNKFAGKARKVYLEGEAYFEVKKNEKLPFIVSVEDVDIKVLGTKFDVSAYKKDRNLETVLLEGSVLLSKNRKLGIGESKVLLKPNQKVSYSKGNEVFNVKDEPNAMDYIAWTEGWFQFSKENLNSVFTKVERYYNIEISVSQDFQYSELITGKLDLKDSLEDVLMALSDVAKIKYRIENNKVYIKNR